MSVANSHRYNPLYNLPSYTHFANNANEYFHVMEVILLLKYYPHITHNPVC